MAAIEQSVEIARSPEDVFACLDALDRHGEWQDGLVVEQVQGDGSVGTRVRERRKLGGRDRAGEWEVTAHDPPPSHAFRGLTDFEPHGIGCLLQPLAVGQARKATAAAQTKLKQILESRGDTG